MEILTWFGRVESLPFPQPNLRSLALASGFVADDAEYNLRLREAALSLVRRQIIEKTTAEQDLLFAIEALDDLSQAINLLDERLYEWSRLHSQKIVHGKDLAEGLKEDENMGTLAEAILGLREKRAALETDVISSVQSLSPNLSALAGPILAARLISRAGSLHNLAGMPSSRLQVMGAEKSLFKHLRGHAPSPKHGIIYRHPAVAGSAKKLRGKVARALAGKLSIAARLDAGGAGLSPDLSQSLQARLRGIKQRGRNSQKAGR